MDKKKNIEDIYPLSPMQQGILFHTLFAPKTGVYVPQICFTLEGSINVSALEQAWQHVVTRQQAFCASFHWECHEKPFQAVYRQVKLPWEQWDWRGFSSNEQQELLKNFLHTDRKRGFDLKKPPLMRITLIQLANDNYQLVWSQHHLILDGWSTALVIKEAFDTYNALHQGQDLPMSRSRPYGDYIAWLQKQDLSVAKEFWKERLKGFTTPTPLRVGGNFSGTSSLEEQDEQQILLPEATTAAMQSLAQQHQLTLNTLVQGAFALLLSRYSDEEDVVFGATCSGRPATLAGVESMVGLFINTLPVRVHVPCQEFIIPWLKKLQTQQAEALQYEYSPLLEIQEWSDLPRGLPLFENILVFENYPVDPSLLKEGKNIGIREVRSIEWTSFPITVLVAATSRLSLKVKYDCNRFDAATITRMLGHFRTLLEGMVANPQQRLSELPLLTKAERQQLLVEWNNTQAEYPKNQCIHQLFEATVERSPDAIAVVFDLQQLSYRELNQRANQLAHHLRSLGVGPEVLVGICVERSLEMVVGILGILKAGGSYVPIDPAYPPSRLALMMDDAAVLVLLTQASLVETLPQHQAQVFCLDTDWKAIAQCSQENLISGVTTKNSAYVIYTSGSTGRSKGAINTHLGLCNRLLWMQKTYQLTATDRVLQKTPFSFDVSVWEFFWPLIVGASLVVAQPGGHQDSAYLVKLVANQQITTLHFVPSMLQVFLEEPGLEACNCLKRVICSGEALQIELQKRFKARLNAELHNLYGPTEAAIDVTFWSCQIQSDLPIVPIGRPIANTQIYLLDRQEQVVPIGVPGELHIGGDGLARGYLNRPELTAEKFIPNRFSNQVGTRLYKTGDLARYRSDGNIEFLGRLDHQVKIRGFRIELGEIEVVLAKHPDVLASVVIDREDQPGNKHLAAYVVLKQEQDVQPHLRISASHLRRFLKESLPDYMVPADFVMLEKLPLLPNGKVNRRALPAPDTSRSGVVFGFVPPRNPVEEVIAAIWIDILKLEKIGIYDNFFELGGNSLSATQVNSRVRQAFEVDLPLRSLFEKPTVVGLAERIETMRLTMQQLSRPSINVVKGRKEIEL